MKNPKSNLTKIAVVITIAITFLVPNGVLAQGAKNIIVMISDGCGYNHIDATSIYQYGRTGVQVYERFPIRYAMSTYSAGNFNADGSWQYQGSYDPEPAWNWFNYVKSGYTDSASASTAMSTGIKTYDAAIGVASNKNRLKHVSAR
ncbi:hypothetical protein FJZ31_31380 [Candidatus Poribacteria bacterium]|nr:hypothetical protein [Candidatus Poribacteria bacterium]